MSYLSTVVTEPTPQSEPLDERQAPNSAGGYSYPVDDRTRLDRFLVLGSEGGSYYASERQLTLENADAVVRCARQDGAATVERIADVILNGRAPKLGPPLFALAVCAAHGDEATRKQALEQVPRLARTGSQLMQFVAYADSLRGWGRGLRNAVRDWYLEKDPSQVAYHVVKYRQRQGWTHRDLLRKSHALVEHENTDLREIFQWVTHWDLPAETEATRLVHAFEEARDRRRQHPGGTDPGTPDELGDGSARHAGGAGGVGSPGRGHAPGGDGPEPGDPDPDGGNLPDAVREGHFSHRPHRP